MEQFLKELPPELAVPPDHQILFEQTARRNDDGEETQDKLWRSYYLFRRAELTGEYLTDAEVQFDPNTGRRSRDYLRQRGCRSVRKSLGFKHRSSDGNHPRRKVSSAPTIEGRIGGGRARITLGGFRTPTSFSRKPKTSSRCFARVHFRRHCARRSKRRSVRHWAPRRSRRHVPR